MKKMIVVAAALSLTVALFSSANAGFGRGMGGGGCDSCAQQGGAPAEPFRKFQADTIDLRQEMMMKRFEVQRENLKGTPDLAKIAALQADIKTLQTKILAVRSQSGLPVGKRDGECVQKMGDCGKGMGGCNGAPCGAQK